MIRVDLHVHTLASYDYQQKDEPIISVLEAAGGAGLDAIAITDHNTFQGYETLLKDLSRLKRREPSRYAKLSAVAVLPGIEVSCLGGRGGLHLIGVFDPDRCKLGFVARSLRLKDAVADEMSGGTRLDMNPEEIASIIHRYGGLVIAAHVGTHNGILHECRPELARLLARKCHFDALEYSRETHGEEAVSLRQAQQIAHIAGIPLIASSDAHVLVTKGEGVHRRGIGERYTELECDRADFATIRETLALPEKVYRESVEALRQPWRNDTRLREAVRAGRSPAVDFIYSDRDTPRLIKLINSLLNTRGGSLLIGVGGGPERVRIGSKRLRLSEAELKATIQGNIDPMPDVDVFSADLGDGRTIVQVLVDKSRNPLFYFTSAGRAFAREQRRVVSLEMNCDLVVGPFLRELGRSTLVHRSTLTDRVEKLSTNRQAALLTSHELLYIFPMRYYLHENPGLRDLLIESIVEAGTRLRDARLRTWAQELNISPIVAERIMADKTRRLCWAEFKSQRYKPLVDRSRTSHRQRALMSAALAALKRQYLRGDEDIVPLDTPVHRIADNLGFLFDWREPRLEQRMQQLIDEAQSDLERLLADVAGRVDTFLVEVGQADLESVGRDLLEELLVMPETQIARRTEEAPVEAGRVVLVPRDMPVTLTLEDIMDSFVDQEQLEDDEAVQDRLEHIIRLGFSRVPIWIWVSQFSTKLALERALLELRERRETRGYRTRVLRRIEQERTDLVIDEEASNVDELILRATTADDPDLLERLLCVCVYDAKALERCRKDKRLKDYLLRATRGDINPRHRRFRFSANLLCIMGLENEIAEFIQSQKPHPNVPAGVETIAFSQGEGGIPILEACLESQTRVMAFCAARCLIWMPQYGISRIRENTRAMEEGERFENLHLSALAGAMGQCRLEEFQDAVEILAVWAMEGDDQSFRQQARESLVQLDKRRYLPSARASFGWMERGS